MLLFLWLFSTSMFASEQSQQKDSGSTKANQPSSYSLNLTELFKTDSKHFLKRIADKFEISSFTVTVTLATTNKNEQNAGVLNGPFSGISTNQQIEVKGSLKDGMINSDIRVINPKNNAPIVRYEFQNGQLQKTTEYNETTNEEKSIMHFVDGHLRNMTVCLPNGKSFDVAVPPHPEGPLPTQFSTLGPIKLKDK